MRWLLAVLVGLWLFGVIVTASFIPMAHPDGLEYLFVWPTGRALWVPFLATALALLLSYVLVARAATRMNHEDREGAKSGRWVAPLALLGLAPLGILPAVPGIGERGAVLSYFFYDLRWWWMAALTGWTIVRADRVLGGPLARRLSSITTWPRAGRRLLLDATLFAGVLVWTLATAPVARFDSALSGDEPKYIRFCELWYQGGGLDISRLRLVSEEPLDAPPHLVANLRHAAAVVPEVIRDLTTDLRAFARAPTTFQWNRVRAENGFVTGKHGGVYQVHQPGVAAAVMPGYVVDRYLIALGAGSDGKFPDALPVTDLMMLLWAGACAVALFRLLTNALGVERDAWLWAVAGVLTLPTSAFAYQFYPELPALFVVLVAMNAALFGRLSSPWAAAGLGAAIGSLAWLHPRFLLVAFLLTLACGWRARGRARVALVAASGLVVLSLLTFIYHVSGSFLPTSLWEANDQGVSIGDLGFVLNFIGYGLDRTWGVLPHAPILIAAFAGLILLARTSSWQAALVATVACALVVPSAGHSLNAAGTTPGRLIVAIVPLLIWPAALLFRQLRESPAVRTLALVALVLSFEASLTYNQFATVTPGAMTSEGFSGWRPNLAFPVVRGEAWDRSRANFVVFVVMVVSLTAFIAAAFWRTRSGGRPRAAARPRPRWIGATIAIVAVVALSSATTAAIGDWTGNRYLLRAGHAQSKAIDALLDRPRCRACFSTRHRQLDWKHLTPNSARGAHAVASVDQLALRLDLVVDGDDAVTAFGRARAEFGDGSVAPWAGVIGTRTVTHTYSRPGTYRVVVWFDGPAGGIKSYVYTVEVRG
jgi:hypothetical protein